MKLAFLQRFHNDGVLTALSNNVDINVVDDRGYNYTPLHYAAKAGHFKTVQFLIKNGANVNARNQRGVTPLHVAAESGHVPVGSILLNHGAEIEASTHGNTDNAGETPLHWAAFWGKDDFIKLLLDRGANYKARRNDNKSPSQRAIDNNQQNTARLIKNYNRELELKARSQTLTAFQEKEQKIVQLETQCQQQASEINELNHRLYQRGGFFKQINSRVTETTTHPLFGVAMLFVGAALSFSDKENFTNNQKLSGTIVGFVGFMLLAFNMLKIGKSISGAFSQVHEKVIANLDSSQQTIDIIGQSTTKTLETFRNELKALSDQTQTVMVQLQNQFDNTLVTLTGSAEEVAKKIQEGVDKNKFAPHVVANLDVRVASGNSCLVM